MAYHPGQEQDVGVLFANGAAVELDTFNMLGWITVFAIAGPGYTGSSTITFETADADPIDPCVPGNDWNPISQSLVCGPDGEPVELTLSEPNGELKCWVRIDCRCRYVRAVVSGTSTNVSVVAMACSRQG